MDKEITVSLTTESRNAFEASHPVNIYGLGLGKQRFALTIREAQELAIALVNSIATAAEHNVWR